MAKMKKEDDKTTKEVEDTPEVETQVSEVPDHPPIYSEYLPGVEPINPYVDDPHADMDEVADHGANTPEDKES